MTRPLPRARRTPRALSSLALAMFAACGVDSARESDSDELPTGLTTLDADSSDATTSATTGGSASATTGAATGDTMTSTSDATADATTTGDTLDPSTTGAPPSLHECGFPSDSFGAALQGLDVPLGSPETLVFTVQGLPPPEVIQQATLRFDSHDADHPGEEGVIRVNGAGPYDLPADLSWDNQDGSGEVDVTGATVAGANTIEFGAGSLASGSYYFVGNVTLVVDALVSDCPEPPPPAPTERTVWYQDATYTKRHNWVLRCDDYAFTAHGDEHLPEDCDGLYAPDGTRKGKAIFAFPDLTEGTYEIRIRARHTVNRNPLGALFVVDGEGKRVDQRDDLSYTTDVWGSKALAGDVEVVLDSSMESESDSVIWVKLAPL